jgi:hypothetical protein
VVRNFVWLDNTKLMYINDSRAFSRGGGLFPVHKFSIFKAIAFARTLLILEEKSY